MTVLQINLSSRPFVNHTLYHVGYVLIGLAGLLLMAHSAFWFFSNHGDVRLMEQEIAALRTEVDGNIREARSLAQEIEAIQRNRRFREVCTFVDSRIRQRRFSWIRMLNLLQEAIPPDVKIESITPRVQQDSVRITLACLARKEEAVNEFIENLEGIGDFDRVLITSEDREGSTVSFPLTMEYSPLELSASAGGGVGAGRAARGDGDPSGTAARPEPGSLAEAVSLARLPDPDVPEAVDFDPFAVEGGELFSGEDDIFSGMEPFGEGFGEEPGFSLPAEPDDAAVGSGSMNTSQSSGAMIKKPPRKPGERNSSKPASGSAGGRR
jgi:Tfp pilus assembly protein PilN